MRDRCNSTVTSAEGGPDVSAGVVAVWLDVGAAALFAVARAGDAGVVADVARVGAAPTAEVTLGVLVVVVAVLENRLDDEEKLRRIGKDWAVAAPRRQKGPTVDEENDEGIEAREAHKVRELIGRIMKCVVDMRGDCHETGRAQRRSCSGPALK